MMNCDLMTVKDVANRCKVSDRYIRLLIARGELPAVKLGRAVRISVVDLTEFLEARKAADVAAFENARKTADGALATLHVAS